MKRGASGSRVTAALFALVGCSSSPAPYSWGLADASDATSAAPEGGSTLPDVSGRSCDATSVTIEVVDYFSGDAVSSTATDIDGTAAGVSPFCLGPGVHPLSITAPGHATYNGAIQLPGGATSRTVRLFPLSNSVSGWLAQVNIDRQANGATLPVQLDSGLMIAAWDHAVDMGVQGYYAHFDPHGFAPTTRSMLLGSMLVGLENLAGGAHPNYIAAEASLMAERASLPNQTASDCAMYDSLAGHYCNIVAPSHNWVGLAISDVPGSPNPISYDQEFGDLYGYFDTTVMAPEPAVSAGVPLTLLPAAGYTFSYEFVQAMEAPTPISIATLNADPRCLTMCPSNDLWWGTGNTPVGSTGPIPYTPMLAAAEIVFVTLNTNYKPFASASVYAAFWGGGMVKPDTYGSESKSYLVP